MNKNSDTWKTQYPPVRNTLVPILNLFEVPKGDEVLDGNDFI